MIHHELYSTGGILSRSNIVYDEEAIRAKTYANWARMPLPMAQHKFVVPLVTTVFLLAIEAMKCNRFSVSRRWRDRRAVSLIFTIFKSRKQMKCATYIAVRTQGGTRAVGPGACATGKSAVTKV